jgi:transposase
MMDERGRVIKQGKIKNCAEDVKKFLEGIDGGVKGVMEATRNWTLMYDMLEEELDEVKLAHPLKVRAIAEAKVKTDKIDSSTLAHLLRCDLLPEAHVPTRDARYIKQVLRQRMFFVKIQTMVKNRIREIIDKHPEVGEPPVKGLFGDKGIEWLKGVKLPEIEKKVLMGEIDLLEAVRERIKKSDKLVEELGKRDERVKLLMSIPGIGKFFALLLCYEIDDINRFSDYRKLHAYAGLVPSTYASGNKVIHGRISKDGNKWIRWAAIEAVYPAIIADKWIKRYYEDVKSRRGGNRAKVATARKLLTIVYCVLKEKRTYKVPGCPVLPLAVSRD